MTQVAHRPAFYATGRGTGGVRDWLTLLHPPYTAWHLSYVAIGAALAPQFAVWRMGGAVLAFFLAVGVGAHAADELHGHPLRTGIADRTLAAVGAVAVAAAVAMGLAYAGWRMVPFALVGALLVAGYNFELFGGLLHNQLGFSVAWGAFPVLTGYYAQGFTLGAPAFLAAAAATGLSCAQRSLSTPARGIRRRTRAVEGRVVADDGSSRPLDEATILAPLEQALQAMAWAVAALAAALVLMRL
ncbi:MAG TPA: hypothetical protein VFJ21_08245 [Mycobacteriales bacterium]|jgi:hypothetical protein|nr:hypothetical protein [Mycobacteriales bacterium]